MEHLLTSDAVGQLWNICLTDPNSGSSSLTFKGGVSSSHSLTTIGQDYVISADKDKPFIYIWNISRNDEKKQSLLCPGKIGSLAVSPDGRYMVFTVEEKAHLWQFATNKKCAVVSNHYRAISVVKFTDDGSYFITGGDDNMVFVWSVARLAADENGTPRYVWDQHTNRISDISIGVGGIRALVVTASLDQTFKTYSLASGQLLQSVALNTSLTAIALSPSNDVVYVGAANGNVYKHDYTNVSRSIEFHYENEEISCFKEHSKPVTCLAVSMDGCILASGSEDNRVIIWDAKSAEINHSIVHSGPVTNVTFALLSSDIENNKSTPSISLPNKIKLTDTEEKINPATEILIKAPKCMFNEVNCKDDRSVVPVVSSTEINVLKRANDELYAFCLEKILSTESKKKKKSKAVK